MRAWTAALVAVATQSTGAAGGQSGSGGSLKGQGKYWCTGCCLVSRDGRLGRACKEGMKEPVWCWWSGGEGEGEEAGPVCTAGDGILRAQRATVAKQAAHRRAGRRVNQGVGALASRPLLGSMSGTPAALPAVPPPPTLQGWCHAGRGLGERCGGTGLAFSIGGVTQVGVCDWCAECKGGAACYFCWPPAVQQQQQQQLCNPGVLLVSGAGPNQWVWRQPRVSCCHAGQNLQLQLHISCCAGCAWVGQERLGWTWLQETRAVAA